MSKRMKGFTCCGNCIHYNYKKHKCNLGASIETDVRNSFYDDCPIPDIPNEQEIRDKAIDEFYKMIEAHMKIVGTTYLEDIKEIAEQMKDVGE